MKFYVAMSAALLLSTNMLTTSVMAADGMLNVKSSHNVKQTADRLVEILNNKGMTVFNRISHSDAAQRAGIELRDTELVIFGNAKAGSPLMLCEQSTAIDLPQKALVWQDAESSVWISYNDPAYLRQRHAISGCDAALDKISKALAGITKAAAAN